MSIPGLYRDKRKFVEFAEKCCDTLHHLHDSNPQDSPERVAIEIAAKALLFSLTDDRFRVYLCEGDELTPEQHEHLRQLGLE
ncbi:MAG: hypothetical protein JWP89_614 [Schlesneria sp.]|nr:hypothetical protein [Schlesneria sp.]